jgi:acetyl-CoA carboxylase carboxyl transferase subunit alpha
MDLDFEHSLVEMEERIAELQKENQDPNARIDNEIADLRQKIKALEKSIYRKLSPWQTVQVARHPNRPLFSDYVKGVFDEFIELHGDRAFGDDKALVGGFATIDQQRVMLLGMSKGKTVEDKVRNNFGMPNPEGYRKALRLMRLAEKYDLPIICLIDTPAAYPGKEAEERGQAEAIARNLTEMAAIEVPIIVMVTGEGGSGGALAIAIGDVILMLSNSIYSVIPPEGCAAILWRDAKKAPEAAEALRVTAPALLDLGVIDEIIEEPAGGAHRNYEAVFKTVREALLKHLHRLKRMSGKRLIDKRFDKFAAIGKFDERKYAVH